MNKYITPSKVGSMPLDAINPEDLIMLLSPILGAGHSRAAQLTQIIINAALRDAVRRRIIAWNPMDCVDRVQHRKQMTRWLTTDEARKLLDATKDTQLYPVWLLAVCCGLRRGELMALRWTDIDFQNSTIHVRRQMIRGVEKPPKSAAGCRDIPLAAPIRDELLRIRRTTDCRVLPYTEKVLRVGLRNACRCAGIQTVTLHGLRHTMAATAASEGIPIKVLQSILGHAQYSTTADIYAHVDRKAMQSAAQIVAIATIRREGARLEIV